MVFLNRQRQSRTETNRRGFNFLITSRGCHRYSILHKSMWSPGSLYLPLPSSLSLSLILYDSVFPSSLFSLLLSFCLTPAFPLRFSHSVPFCSAFHRGGGLEENTPPLVSSPHCCVAIETKGMEMYVMVGFFGFPGAGSNDGGKKERMKKEM